MASIPTNYGAPFVSKFFLKNYGSGTNQMGWFCRWGSIFENGRFLDLKDSLILYLSFRS